MLALADPVDLDNGPRTNRSGTMRMCAVTRQVRPIDELIRFVVGPGGEVVPDLKRKLPGRGLWVSASGRTVAEAVRRHQFSKGFKRDVRVAPTLPQDTENLLVRGAIEALAMAAKAGQVVAGFAKVEGALQQHQAVALIHAADGAADGIRKLDAILGQNTGKPEESREIPAIRRSSRHFAGRRRPISGFRPLRRPRHGSGPGPAVPSGRPRPCQSRRSPGPPWR